MECYGNGIFKIRQSPIGGSASSLGESYQHSVIVIQVGWTGLGQILFAVEWFVFR